MKNQTTARASKTATAKAPAARQRTRDTEGYDEVELETVDTERTSREFLYHTANGQCLDFNSSSRYFD